MFHQIAVANNKTKKEIISSIEKQGAKTIILSSDQLWKEELENFRLVDLSNEVNIFIPPSNINIQKWIDTIATVFSIEHKLGAQSKTIFFNALKRVYEHNGNNPKKVSFKNIVEELEDLRKRAHSDFFDILEELIQTTHSLSDSNVIPLTSIDELFLKNGNMIVSAKTNFLYSIFTWGTFYSQIKKKIKSNEKLALILDKEINLAERAKSFNFFDNNEIWTVLFLEGRGFGIHISALVENIDNINPQYKNNSKVIAM